MSFIVAAFGAHRTLRRAVASVPASLDDIANAVRFLVQLPALDGGDHLAD